MLLKSGIVPRSLYINHSEYTRAFKGLTHLPWLVRVAESFVWELSIFSSRNILIFITTFIYQVGHWYWNVLGYTACTGMSDVLLNVLGYGFILDHVLQNVLGFRIIFFNKIWIWHSWDETIWSRMNYIFMSGHHTIFAFAKMNAGLPLVYLIRYTFAHYRAYTIEFI